MTHWQKHGANNCGAKMGNEEKRNDLIATVRYLFTITSNMHPFGAIADIERGLNLVALLTKNALALCKQLEVKND